jgi:hypothetical protein
MMRISRFAWVSSLVVAISLVACGGGSAKKDTKKATAGKTMKKKKVAPLKVETEEDRAQKREAAAGELIAAGSTCLPVALKDPEAKMSLELGAVGQEAILCAMDHDPSRSLGAVGCWTIDLAAGGLAFRDRNAIPGRGYSATVQAECVRGYCLPKDQEVTAGAPALIAWNLDGKQVAVVVGEQVHLFDAESKELAKSFSLQDPAQGDKVIPGAAKGLWFLGENLFLQGGEGNAASMWMYKSDGSAAGQMQGLSKGNTPVAMSFGSFSVIDKDRVAVAERGFSSLTIFEVATGKRTKLVRKISQGPCRSAQVENFFSDAPGEIPAKCAAHLKDTYGHFLGTTMVAGSKNFLGALSGDRVGELAVIDSKNLSEKRSIKLPWCEAAVGAAAKTMMEKSSAEATDDAAGMTDDPDAGGQAAESAEPEAAPVKAKSKSKKK